MDARLLLLSVILLCASVNAGKILFWTPLSTKSVKITFTPVLEALAERGHDVTVAMPFAAPKDAKYKVINSDPDGDFEAEVTKTTKKIITNEDPNMVNAFIGMVKAAVDSNDRALSHPMMQGFLKDTNTKFDIVIVQPFLAGESGYFLAKKFNAPFAIYYTGQVNMPFVSSALGQPFNPSYDTFGMLPFVGEMSFIQRCINTFASFMFEHVFRNMFIHSKVNALLDKHFPGEDRPSLLELERNASAAFSFGHPLILDGWSPMSPNFVQLGMMNCRPAKPFAQGDKLGEFLDKSKNGVIFISFGSAVKGSLMPEENRKLLLKVFGRLSQYDVIWKWETEEMEGKPDNVLLSKWLPQQEILAHPKLKVFITHAGQSSFQETLCHQKPVVAIPISGDQPNNAAEVERLGFGINQPWTSLTEDGLYDALDKVLHDPKYAEAAKRIGSTLNDQLTRPLDRAIWWIEHIMRHPTMYEGRSPVHKLRWFQYFLLDVLAFFALILFIVYKFVKFVICKLCCRSGADKTKKD